VNLFTRLSIKNKIILLVVFVSTSVSLVSVFTFYNHENAETLKRERRDVAAIASLIANQTSVYVEFSADAVSMSSNTGLTNLINSFDSTDHIKSFSF
jgi:sensor histidine kinase regulating citrate/malate metabolism